MYRGQKKIFLAQLQVSIYLLTSDLFCFMDTSVFACAYIYVVHAWCSRWPEEGARSRETVVTVGCELLFVLGTHPRSSTRTASV